jgi:serine/threonine protein kinase
VTIVKLKGRSEGKEYVMKIVEKAKIKEENLLQSNYLEVGIVKDDNPFIVKILHVSQNRRNIYIVM